MYRNQYIVTSMAMRTEYDGLSTVEFNGLYIISHKTLNVFICNGTDAKVALIGYAFDPLRTNKSTVDLVKRLSVDCLSKEDFF